MLAFAQKKSGAHRLSGLANWMLGKSKPVTENLHSRVLRKEMAAELKTNADHGNLEAMLQTISNSDYFQRDYDGFSDAQKAYKVYDSQLKAIKQRQGLALKANVQYQSGLYLAKIIAVTVFVLTLIITMS